MRDHYHICRRPCFCRKGRGSSIVELPLALWLVILGFCFPLFLLCVTFMRFGFFWNACREAAKQAAQCQTFQADSAVGKSAVNTADTVALLSANSFNGISIVPPVNVYIVYTDATSGVRTENADRQKLLAAANTDQNIYEIKVELKGNIEPLIRYPVTGMLGSVPGLTGPFPIAVRSQYPAEVPQGLNK